LAHPQTGYSFSGGVSRRDEGQCLSLFRM
jgi:hypothetical protein